MDETLAFRIVCLYKYFLAYCQQELKKLGVSFGQLPFLLYVGKHPDCTQKQLTEGIRIDWGYSQRSIAKLVENGLLVKENRENCHLKLTDAGNQAFALSHQVFKAWDQTHTTEFTEQEREELYHLLGKLLHANEA